MDIKICGVKDLNTLKYIIEHPHPPWGIGFITNYKKSKRYIDFQSLKKLINVSKNGINFVSVLVNPDEYILEKIKNINFDFYQLYDVSPKKTELIKKKYKKKIITSITVKNKSDVNKYKKFKSFSDIILFDSKGYEKSLGFDHRLLNDVPSSINKMLGGNIQFNDRLDKYSKIKDINDISGSLETSGEKDISKIDIFLKNIKKINDET